MDAVLCCVDCCVFVWLHFLLIFVWCVSFAFVVLVNMLLYDLIGLFVALLLVLCLKFVFPCLCVLLLLFVMRFCGCVVPVFVRFV